MLDTKLKKTHKLTTLIIALTVLIPALIITGLYPRMEAAANKLRNQYEAENNYEELAENEVFWYIQENFPSFVVEATYCMYGEHLLSSGENVNLGVLEEYEWFADYEMVMQDTEYYVDYGDEVEQSNGDLKLNTFLEDSYSAQERQELLNKNDLAGYVEITYDSNGNITKVQIYTNENVEYLGNARTHAEDSQSQYLMNTEIYNDEREAGIDADTIVPKNVRAIFALTKDSSFMWNEVFMGGAYSYCSSPQLYLNIGALALILIMAAVVALVALILPFFKKLETGWEKPFCLSFEWMVIIAIAGTGGACLMYEAMCYTSMYELQIGIPELAVEFIGFTITVSQLYKMLLVLNFVGWALLFWMEYMVVSSFRQFLCGPKWYIKNRIFCIRAVRWCVRKGKGFWKRLTDYITKCELSQDLHRKLLVAVLVNGAVLILFCVIWLFGIIGVIVYSVVLYGFVRKVMEKIQADYQSVKETVHQMAEGNLNIAVPADLGMFQSLGEELGQVKEGFAKAVAEEAKSQNMKTELITNVSHDLKTPLTAIITYVDLLGKEDITEEERKSYIDTLAKKSQRLKVLIEDLFEVSKAQSGNITLHPMNVDVVSLMKQVRTEMEDKIADSDLIFRWNLPEDKVVLYLDGQKTYRVFENLLNNILKYAMPNSRVYIDVVDTAYDVQIMFRNISKTEMDFDADHLTDRFVRGDASRNSEGSGLGLAIAKSFVELQGGNFKIDVDGDLFKVILRWDK